MASQLPPTPPLGPEGFAASTWQRWLDILRKRLAESYSPGNPPPEGQLVGASHAQMAEMRKQLQQVALQVSLLPNSLPAIAALRKLSVLMGSDAALANTTITGTLAVTGTASFGVTGTAGLIQLKRASDGLAVGTDTMVLNVREIDNSAGDIVLKRGSVERIRATGTGATVTGGLTVTTGFGCNGKAPQTAVALPANATDLATAITLVNAIKAALIADGIAS